jgi:hypothetical protein
MTTAVSSHVSSAWTTEGVNIGGSFGVQWLSVCDLPFSKTKEMLNPLNNNEFLNKSRDTQEVPWDLGIYLSKLCVQQESY